MSRKNQKHSAHAGRAGQRAEDGAAIPGSQDDPGLADTLTPHRQASLVLSHLSSAQLGTYSLSSGLDPSTSRQDMAVHYAQQRLSALQQAAAARERSGRRQGSERGNASARPGGVDLPQNMSTELADATAVRDKAARTWTTVTKTLVQVGVLTGVGFLIFGLLGMFYPPLLGVAGLFLVISFLTLFVLSTAAEAAGYRSARVALVDWAVVRPGQLERGLPALGVRAESTAAEALEGCVTIAAEAVVLFCAPMTVVLFAVALLDQKVETWQITGVTAAIGLLAFLAPRVGSARTFLITRGNWRVDESLAWVYAAAAPEAPASHKDN